MNQLTWQQATSYESLLAIGVTVVMAGIILRGFAASSRRDLARRKQHLLDERRSGEADLSRQLERPPSWFEKNLGLLANLVLAAGVVLSVVSYFRE